MPDRLLPPPPVRSAIAGAVHAAIVAGIADPGFDPGTHCLLWAVVGAAVAARVTGRPYAPACGSIRVRIRPDGGGIELVADPHTLVDGPRGSLGFHAWIGGAARGGRAELVDLTSRYFPRWAAAAGVAWELPPPPPFLWEAVRIGRPALVGHGHGPHDLGLAAYRGDAALTRQAVAWWFADPARTDLSRRLVEAATAAARHALGGSDRIATR